MTKYVFYYNVYHPDGRRTMDFSPFVCNAGIPTQDDIHHFETGQQNNLRKDEDGVFVKFVQYRKATIEDGHLFRKDGE